MWYYSVAAIILVGMHHVSSLVMPVCWSCIFMHGGIATPKMAMSCTTKLYPCKQTCQDFVIVVQGWAVQAVSHAERFGGGIPGKA